YGASCTEVSIDTLTGEYLIDRTDILHDVGRSLNPAIDIGQIDLEMVNLYARMAEVGKKR
ncbi:MAG: molybdopterin cofactor-binding domain-containing protein, partial [Myxococcaceae bacterium]